MIFARKIKKWLGPLLKLLGLWIRVKIKSRKSKKILVIAEFGRFGGTRTYFFSLIQFLHKHNYQIVVELGEGQQDQEVMRLINELELEYITREYDFGRIAYFDKFWTKFNINPAKMTIHALIHYLRILYLYRISSVIASVGTAEKYLFVFLLPNPVLYIIHTVIDDKIEKIRAVWLRILSRQKQILTVSNFSKEAIISNWYLRNKKKYVQFVYNHYDYSDQQLYYEKSENQLTILTIGSVECYKNPLIWIEVAKRITNKYKNVTFYWLGDGSQLEKCRDLTSDDQNIFFVGYDSNVEWWYQRVSIYFQPSIKESFGISVAGAMAHSLPCVVSCAEGLPEIIVNEKSGYIVNCKESEDAFLVLCKLIDDKELREATGGYARREYENRFHKQQWLINMHEVLLSWQNK